MQQAPWISRHADPCDLAPPGWVCTREIGHDGPCAAWPLYPDLLPAEDSGPFRRTLNWLLERLARLFT